MKGGDVAGPVSYDGQGFLGQGRNDQFPHGSRRQHFSRFRINDFRQEMVFVDVHALEGQTLSGDSRTNQLTHAVIFRGK